LPWLTLTSGRATEPFPEDPGKKVPETEREKIYKGNKRTISVKHEAEDIKGSDKLQ
jgi:hypothetical protein